jgi:putative mRNA 3-end processing factor
MVGASMPLKANITEKGAILLGDHVACDAFDQTKPLRVVTHAHSDHTVGLRESLRKCEKVLMTEATKGLVDAMMGPNFLMRGHVETVDYCEPIQLGKEKMTLFPADHILGAAQVLVEDSEGVRVAYTGDFRIEDTPVLEADVLVMEATYGNPACKRPFQKDVDDILTSLVEKGLQQGSVYIFGYHGKLQEVMHILREAGVKAPFVAPEKIFHLSKVCEQHGMNIGRLMLSDEKEGKELLNNNSSCVAFYHTGAKKEVEGDALRVIVSGWEFSKPCRRTGEKEYTIALSDHSDFDGLVEYVRRSKPKLVITDSFRDSNAETFAKEIRKRFAISAEALPKT